MNTLTPEACSQRLLHFINDVLPSLDRKPFSNRVCRLSCGWARLAA